MQDHSRTEEIFERINIPMPKAYPKLNYDDIRHYYNYARVDMGSAVRYSVSRILTDYVVLVYPDGSMTYRKGKDIMVTTPCGKLAAHKEIIRYFNLK